ncbi:hypothetical protein GAY33_03270 [Azospirillum brasilense]|uniref:hypothetical protein n=1 Tax=Azospirillum argentinense TaxID=2970906 RepID=UPI00190D6786|nr:hypothetical protein [Azospirillum argentinense]MBK3798267.1 hypothetical protein [Azospirillum argentinense]
MSGFYLMHRGWRANPVFKDEPYTEREAWEWIIENSAWKPTRVRIKSVVVDVRRGQLAASLRFMAEAWQWQNPRVSRFLTRLEKEGMIECIADAGVTVITVCNYEQYQSPASFTDTPVDAAPMQDRYSSDAKKKEGNKDKEPISLTGESSALPGDALPDLAEQGVVTSPANDNPPEPAKQTKRGTRVPDGDLPDDWAQAANHTREKHQMPLLTKRVLGLRWENFRNYWGGLAGSKGLKADWRKTWLNDCISPVTERKFPAGQPPPVNANAPPQAKRQASSLSEIPLFFDTPTEV